MPAGGLQGVNDFSWGSHLCLFYRSPKEFLEVTATYLKAGLAELQLCLWVIPAPLTVDQAGKALERHGVDVAEHVAAQQLHIVSYEECFLPNGRFDPAQASSQFTSLITKACHNGFSGVRSAGGPGQFISLEHRQAFIAFERTVTHLVREQPCLVLCGYPTADCSGADMLEVMAAHASALMPFAAGWKTIAIES